MDSLMKSILTTVANSTDAVKPGVAECVRERIEDDSKCQGCQVNDATEIHSCPYQEEINDCFDENCNCCADCTHECAMDI